MLRYIKGILSYKGTDTVVVEAGGLGYEIHTADNSGLFLKAEGEELTVYTCMQFREDGVSIYGFEDELSIELFRKLITVNGIGAKAALALLSSQRAPELIKSIITGDVAAVTRANGVGKKTAERLILELKDKLDELAKRSGGFEALPSVKKAEMSGAKAEAVAALCSLGYSKAEASAAVEAVTGEDLGVSEYVRAALRNL